MTEAEARRILAVDATASPYELKRAYRAKLKQWHPDRFASNAAAGSAALRQTQLINAAYRLLEGEAPRREAREHGWSGTPIRTVNSDVWPMRALSSSTTSAAEGTLIFVMVWALLAGTAVAIEKLFLR